MVITIGATIFLLCSFILFPPFSTAFYSEIQIPESRGKSRFRLPETLFDLGVQLVRRALDCG